MPSASKICFVFIALILMNCSSDETKIDDVDNIFSGDLADCNLTEGWLIPPNQVVGGGVGQDGIPSLEEPKFIEATKVDFLTDDDLAVGIKIANEIRIFPHRIIDRHEIVNDQISGQEYTLTFCPLTGSTVTLDRSSSDSYGVSGLLHNSNLIYYNRTDGSFWSQMKLTAVRGESVCEQADFLPSLEMTWANWKENFPEVKVLSNQTGFDRNYNTQSFSQAISENDVSLWPYSPKDERLKNFEKVLVVIIDNQPKAYPLNFFDSGPDLIIDTFNGSQLIVAGDLQKQLITAFEINDSQEYEMQQSAGVMKIRSGGHEWDLFGNTLNSQVDLNPATSYVAYWFSVGAMFPQLEIFNTSNSD